jgi:ABC-type transporter Mla subunit MlaD
VIADTELRLSAAATNWKEGAGEIAATTNGAMQKVDIVIRALRTQAEEIGLAATQGVGRIDDLRGSVRGLVGEVATVAGEATRQAVEIARDTQAESAALLQALQDTLAEMGNVKTAIGREMGDLAKIAGEVRGVATSFRDGVAGPVRELTGSLAAARADGEAAREELRNQAADLAQAADQVSQRLTEIGALIDSRAETLVSAADKALARAGELGTVFERQSQMLGASVKDAAGVAEEMVVKLRAEGENLAKAAQTAVEQTASIQQRQQKTVRDQFLRQASTMIDELNGLALDIHQLLDSDIPEEIWKNFRAGDRSVFARRLFRLKDSYTIPAIEQRYEQDARFRDMVSRYLSKFEELLREANSADQESLLNATFITADVGKLYLVLQRSLERAGHKRAG